MHNRKEMPLGRIQGTVSKERMPIDIGQWQPAKRMTLCRIQGAVSKERMPEASDKGSQPYSRAFRHREMAGMRVARLISACPWVGDMSGSCPLPKGKVPGVGCRSFQPFTFPRWREQ